jgi:hypothetical protein
VAFVLRDEMRTGLYEITVYEVKGMETPEWKLKHKLFKAKYPNLTQEII